MRITTENGKSLRVTRLVELVVKLLGERKRRHKEIREAEEKLSCINRKISGILVNWYRDKNDFITEEAFMKTEQGYDRLMQALLDMKKNFEDQIHSFEDQMHSLSEHIVRANVDDLRHVFEQKKAALMECVKGVDQKIFDCVAEIEEYKRMYSDLRALKEKLHELGADSIQMPELIPTGNLGGMIEARIQQLGAEGREAPKIGAPEVGVTRAQAQAARISQKKSEAIEIGTNEAGRVEEPSAPVCTVEQGAMLQTGGQKATVPAEFFDYLTRAATEAIGPMAQRVLREQISALGESRDAFPRIKLRELVELVSREILNETMRARFQNRIFQEIYALKTLRD